MSALKIHKVRTAPNSRTRISKYPYVVQCGKDFGKITKYANTWTTVNCADCLAKRIYQPRKKGI
jgi:DNA-directed RNA polymerase subunit RPC12/RpoP